MCILGIAAFGNGADVRQIESLSGYSVSPSRLRTLHLIFSVPLPVLEEMSIFSIPAVQIKVVSSGTMVLYVIVRLTRAGAKHKHFPNLHIIQTCSWKPKMPILGQECFS